MCKFFFTFSVLLRLLSILKSLLLCQMLFMSIFPDMLDKLLYAFLPEYCYRLVNGTIELLFKEYIDFIDEEDLPPLLSPSALAGWLLICLQVRLLQFHLAWRTHDLLFELLYFECGICLKGCTTCNAHANRRDGMCIMFNVHT